MTNEESRITISREQKSAIADGIIWGTLTLMNRTIRRESPRKCAMHDSKPYRQSKTAIADNTISINILTNDQKLPARPRDFRETLADEEKNIGNPELSDVLHSIARRHVLEPSKSNFSYPRGRPSSGPTSNDERRGRRSLYHKSRMMQIIDEVLDDQDLFKKIDNAVTNSDIFFKHRICSIEAGLYQMKEQQSEVFLNTYRPFIKKYGFRNSNSSGIERKDITDEMIKKVAKYLASSTNLTESEKKGIYIKGGIIYLDYILQKHRHSTTS